MLSITVCNWHYTGDNHVIQHNCSHSRHDVTTCCSSCPEIPYIRSQICCFKSLILVGCVSYTLLLTVPKEVVWYCTIRQAGGPGVPETQKGIWNLKTSLPTDWCNHIDCHHAQWCLEQLLTQNTSVPAHRTTFPGRFISNFADNTWSACMPDLAVSETAVWSMAKAKHMKHVSQKLIT